MEKQILHVDVNNAFLSWTAVDMLKKGSKVDIREIPSVIGGDESRRSGIVLAKSPKAKMFGISTGETLYQARMKCPGLQVYPVNFQLYKENSNKLYQLLLQYTDKIERFSIDECFLDMTNYLLGDTLLNKAHEINKRVKNELGFTVNVGVAHNKLLAKMASDFSKPNKVHTFGIDNSEVQYKYERPKGIGNSTTLPIDINDILKLEEVLLALTEQVTYRLRTYNLLANVVNVQLRTKDFEDKSHQRKLSEPTSNTKNIYAVAKALLHEMYIKGTPIRLIGMRVDNLVEKDEMQLSLFSHQDSEKQEKLDKVVDDLKQKYGYNSITRAGKLHSEDKIKLKDM